MVPSRELLLKRPSALRKRLFRLERRGRYREALDELCDIWPETDAYPDLSDFSDRDALEMKLRCGALIGFYAQSSNVLTQNVSMNLLTSARDEFEILGNFERIAECDNYLALAYWRTGELREAIAFVDSALAVDLPPYSPIRLHSYIIQCLIGFPVEDKDSRNLALLKSVETAFLRCDDECLKGDYFNHCGMALDNLGRKAEALDHYEFAKYHHERSGHRSYLATVHNNLAWAYQNAGDFRQAHFSINDATLLFREEEDKTREGFSLDTKATLYMAERRYFEALETVEKALAILESGENKQYYIETLLTKSKVYLGLDLFHEAVSTLFEAVKIAREVTGEDSARRLTAEFESAWQQHNVVAELPAPDSPRVVDAETGSIQLLMPTSLANYADYRGVWIHSSRLDPIGVRKGSLAVVATGDVSRGDLVAATEIESGDILCGFYDADFGMIGLEGCDGEILMYDDTAVSILGKIIGVCRDGEAIDGAMIVEPVKI